MFQLFELVIWYLIIQIFSIFSYFIVNLFFDKLEDNGYAMSKIFGMLFFTFIVYFLTRFFDFSFNYLTLIISFLVFVVISYFSFKKNRGKIIEKILSKNFKKYIIITEIVFLASLSLVLFFRSYNPDLDRGEGPMDLAYINSILRSEKLPPQYPWHYGSNLENVYYYFGHFMIASLTKLSTIPSNLIYNFALGTIFALIAVTSFGLGYNLTRKIFFALVVMILITFASNFLNVLHVINAAFPEIDLHIPDYRMNKENDFFWRLFYGESLMWWGTRIIPWTITEFPWFSVLWGDLHAHYVSIPIILLFVNMMLDVVKSNKIGFYIFGENFKKILTKIFLISVVLGFMFPQFIWNYPLYIMFLSIVIFFQQYSSEDKIKLRLFYNTLLIVISIILLSFILYAPVIVNLMSPKRSGLGFEDLKTSLYHFTVLFSLPLFFIYYYFIIKIYNLKIFQSKLNRTMLIISILLYFILFVTVYLNFFSDPIRFNRKIEIKPTFYILFDFQMLLILIPFIGFSLFFLLTKNYSDKNELFLLLMILSGSLIVLMYELISIHGRYIFVFKLHSSVWVMWNASAGFIIYYFRNKFKILKKVSNLLFFIVTLFLVISCTLIYLIITTYVETDKFRVSYGRQYNTLDAIDYMNITFKPEYDAINWINKNIKGNHSILEYPGSSYEFYPRPSTYTGLTAILEWVGHAEQVTQENLNNVFDDITTIYNTTNNDDALKLLKKYNVQYIYIGGMEKRNYSPEGLEKFSIYKENYNEIYNIEDVHIYFVYD